MNIGLMIQGYMQDQGIAVKDMAAHCGVTPGAVSNWFKSGNISKANLAKACALLNVRMEDMLAAPKVLVNEKNRVVHGAPVDKANPLPSGLAMDLACFFDAMLTDRVDRTRGYNEATEAITRINLARSVQPTGMPALPGVPEKLPS